MLEFYFFLIYFFLFAFGAILGSFLNVLILRIHKDEQWWSGRSYCPQCQKNLQWWELIPIFSYFILKFKCSGCKQKISPQYVLVEISIAILAIFLFWKFGFTLQTLLFFFTGYMMIGSFVSDFRFMELPEIFSWGTFALGVIYQIFIAKGDFLYIIYALLFGFFFFWLQYFFTKGEGLGEGDIRLGLIMGIFLSWPIVIFSILTSYIFASITLLPLVFLKKLGRKTMVPLGVFLIPTFLFFLYFYEEIMNIIIANYLWPF